MKSIVVGCAALALVLLLTLTPYTVDISFAGAPVFPWARYSDIGPVLEIQEGTVCEGTVTFVRINDSWSVLSTWDRDIFIHRTSDRVVDYVYFAVGTGNKGTGTINIKRVMSVDEAKKVYPDPCGYFVEVTAS